MLIKVFENQNSAEYNLYEFANLKSVIKYLKANSFAALYYSEIEQCLVIEKYLFEE